MATKSLGRVSIVPQGDYDENQVYKRLDLVKDGGKTYLSLKEDNNSPLLDEDAWMLLTESGKFEDLTPQQLANLKGDKGDPFVYEDFTSEQLADLKGPKGDPFVYEDFTSEQLDTLLQPLNEATQNANTAAEAANEAAGNAITGISGEAKETNSPEPTGFHRYIVTTPITTGSAWGIEVTQAELDNNWIFFNVKDGVITKDSKPANGTNAKLPLYSAIKSANIPAGTQFIYDEGDNEILRTTAILLTTDNPLSVIDVKTKYVGSASWANKNINAFTLTGRYYFTPNGGLINDAAYNATPLYRVKEGMKFKNPFMGQAAVAQAVFFKADNTFLSSVQGQSEITAPAGAFFVGFSRPASSNQSVKVQTDFWATQLINASGVVAENNTDILNGGEAFKGFNRLSNEINISSTFPTGGNSGNFIYDLPQAISKLTDNTAKVGMKIVFRDTANTNVAYRLDGITTGGYAKAYLNPANWVKVISSSDLNALNTTLNATIDSNVNELNVSSKFPTGGNTGGVVYDLPQAVSKLTDNIAKFGMKLTFRDTPTTNVTYKLDGITTGGYAKYYLNPANWVKIVTPNDLNNVNTTLTTTIASYVNELNVSSKFPTGGNTGTAIYDLPQAVSKVTDDIAKVGMKLTFRDTALTNVTYKLDGLGLGGYAKYYLNPANWVKIVTPNDLNNANERINNLVNVTKELNATTGNRLANPLFETITTWNAANPTKTIQEETSLIENPGVSGIRIPVTMITNAGTILTAAEGRPYTDVHDYGSFSIVYSRKVAGGSFVQSTLIPYDAPTNKRYQNPSFLIDRTGVHGVVGRIYLFACELSNNANWILNTTAQADLVYIYSDDDGVTWSPLQSLKSKWDLTKYNIVVTAPNNGIQLTNGTLAVPCYADTNALILTKKVGEDWVFSNIITNTEVQRIDECAIVERADNEIVLIGRNNKNYLKPPADITYFFAYEWANDRFVYEENTFVSNRSNQFSVIKTIIDGKKIYLKSFTDSNTNTRDNITVWASLDLKKWLRVYRLNPVGGNGYSSLSFYDNKLVCAYEREGKNIYFQDITNILPLISTSANTYLEINISVQDRMQMIINHLKGIPK